MARTGRPRETNIDWHEFDKLLALQCKKDEIASWFDCSEDTIERRVKEAHNMTYAEYSALKMGKGKIALRRNQLQLSKTNAAMAIFLGKNWLGQSDKLDQDIRVSNSDEEIRDMARAMIASMKDTSDRNDK